ncbi:hypothetical protein KAF25_005633 [Fusarium avenaceum]|uniref:Uncharacterized protein n=1 Tax=Fusarium avenaceum TaxID=40199 RepID=A0A9P7KQ20_9HYPO|nr:hypothetical protein KAF25_005633 [Fusarium avenaceum]
MLGKERGYVYDQGDSIILVVLPFFLVICEGYNRDLATITHLMMFFQEFTIMELAVLFITLFAMAFMIAANTPLETPRQAIGGAFVAGVLSLLGGAPFVAEILFSTVRNLWKKDIPLEDYMEHQPRVFHRSRTKFDNGDRFYHKYGLALQAMGFTPIAAGSLAACVGSMIGNFAPGSCFAILQSAGMGGCGAEIAKIAARLAAEPSFSVLYDAARKAFSYGKAVPGASESMATTVSKDQDTVISSALKLIGFGKKGITGKSLAAGIHSEIGDATAKGPFASLQSCGGEGYGVNIVNSIIRRTSTAAGIGKKTKRGKSGSKKNKRSSNKTK